MKKTIFIYAILALMFSQFLSSQSEKSDEEYRILAMLSLLSEGLNTNEVKLTQETIIKFLDENVGVSIINQNSFSDFVFISIDPKQKRKYSDDKTMPIIWSNKDCQEYILAIHKWGLYTFKLKGYQINDFYSFLNFMYKNDYENINSPKAFSKNYQVEGLDFKCLYKSLRSKKDSKKYQCLTNTCMKIFKTHDY